MKVREAFSSLENNSHYLFLFFVLVVAAALILFWPPTAALVLPAVCFFFLAEGHERLRVDYASNLPVDLRLSRFSCVVEPGGLHGYIEYAPVADKAGLLDWRKEVQRMPEEFKSLHPKLVMSEENIAGEVGGVPLYGTVDQVFEGRDGRLYIVDTKTHAAPSAPRAEEIVQLSVYRALLALKYGEDRVSEEGFIRSICEGGDGLSIYRRVTLLPAALVAEMAQKTKAARSFSNNESGKQQKAE